MKMEQDMVILATLAAKEKCLVDPILYITGEQENQDGHREEHKYSESLGKREKYLLANRSCKMLLDSLFLFIWDRIF
ncbi:hypothetical protein Bca101_099840 [Brassica carinata]